MRVAYNWLKEYIDFPYSPQELAEKLTMVGLEVDGLEYLGQGLDGIVIGEIKKIEDHPNADKLVICQVETGTEKLQIITGAANVFTGARIPVAPVGVTLPNGLQIKKAKLRGEPSFGMLCSEDELGLSEERAEGIMILPDDAPVGMEFKQYLGLDEYVLKLDLTPNYARCLGLLGIAREIKALMVDEEIKYPETGLETIDEKINGYIEVEIKEADLCPRYTGRLIKNVEIGPSPDWMQQRLKAAGIRPINNIVDITNFVLLEYNQPLHAFDYDRISGKQVIVRRAEEGEKITTLDDKERILDQDVLVIADAERPIAMAGVMGGANSEVTDQTVNVFLESAYFNPVNIRKTARQHSLPSEASHRFERGVDIENLIAASDRAAYLMQKYAGGEVINGIIDQYPRPYQPAKIEVNVDRANTILGLDLSSQSIKEMLERLGFSVEEKIKGLLRVIVPSFRGDVEIEADIYEEIARMFGYNNIPVTNPISKQRGRRTETQKIVDFIRNTVSAAGLDEVITFSLVDEKIYNRLNIPEDDQLRNWVRIKNPLSEAFAIMRTSLLPGVIEVLSNNAKRQLDQMAVFEIGRSFHAQGEEERPLEKLLLAGGSMGQSKDLWNSGAPDFFYLKGIVEKLFELMGVDDVRFAVTSQQMLHPGRSAAVLYRGEEIGVIGEILPEIIDEFDLRKGTTVFQIELEPLINDIRLGEYNYQALPKYPAVSRDLAVIVDDKIEAGQLLDLISATGGKLLKKVNLFDLYQGSQIPAGSKSLAFKLLFQADDRTLVDQEVNELFDLIITKLTEKYKVEVRGI